MLETTPHLDPRVKRTRQFLQNAFLELLREKSIESISIQDITERATINRATFYDHFTDKYALMDSIVREQFRREIAAYLPPNPGWNRHSLQALVRAMFRLLEELHQECNLGEARFATLSKQAVQQELAALLRGWLKTASVLPMSQGVRPELIASAVSWTLFGLTEEWRHDELPLSAEEMTRQLVLVLTEGLAHLAPNFLPE
jgi:AcrR family transcriptional regulator